MKRIILALLTLTLLTPALASTHDVQTGDKAKVPGWTWVDVKNVDPVKNANISFGYDSKCGIEEGGTVTVIGTDASRVLVRYTTANVKDIKAGTACPTGVLFLTTKDTFSKMTAAFDQVQKTKSDELNLVQKLTRK